MKNLKPGDLVELTREAMAMQVHGRKNRTTGTIVERRGKEHYIVVRRGNGGKRELWSEKFWTPIKK